MSPEHTAEQLEAAHRENNVCAAVRIILRHLTASKHFPTLRTCRHLTRLYWKDPATGLAQITTWTPK